MKLISTNTDSKRDNMQMLSIFQVMCTENLQERRELIEALHKGRKLSDLPKITQVAIFSVHWYIFGTVPWLPSTLVPCQTNFVPWHDIYVDAANPDHLGRRWSNIPSGISAQIKKVKMISWFYCISKFHLFNFSFMLFWHTGIVKNNR